MDLIKTRLIESVFWRRRDGRKDKRTLRSAMVLDPLLSVALAARRRKADAPKNANRTGEGDGQMKASVLFGAGWENDSLEVLWRDAGRVFCRLCAA